MKFYPEDKVAEIQGDHRFFQCSRQCTDEVWDAVEPVKKMIESLGEDKTAVPDEPDPPLPPLWCRGFPLGTWLRQLSGRKEVSGAVSESLRLDRAACRQEDSLPGAWRGKNHTDVYPGTVLEPHPRFPAR